MIIDPSKLFNSKKDTFHSFQLFAIIVLMDSMWFLRNQITHHLPCQPPIPFTQLVIKIFTKLQCMWNIKIQVNNNLLEWSPPPIGQFSFSYNVVVGKNGFTAVAICRSNSKEIIFAKTQYVDSVNPNFGEAMAAKLAMEAIQYHITQIIIEGENHVVISTITNPSKSLDWSILNILSNISSLLKSFQS